MNNHKCGACHYRVPHIGTCKCRKSDNFMEYVRRDRDCCEYFREYVWIKKTEKMVNNFVDKMLTTLNICSSE